MSSKKATAILIAILMASTLFAAVYKTYEDSTPTICGEVINTDKYGNLQMNFTSADMENAGFKFGDYTTMQIGDVTIHSAVFIDSFNCAPYFSYFITESKGTIVVGVFCGAPLSVETGTKVIISYSGKCAAHSFMDILVNEKTTPSESSTIEDYANFYEVTGGNLLSGKVYRSYSPISISEYPSKSSYVSELIEQYGINFMIMLPYTENNLKNLPPWMSGTYTESLIKGDKHVAVDMKPTDLFTSPEKTKTVLLSIRDNDGPYVILCEKGKDRTGLMVMLVQGLCGASNEEIEKTFMRAFVNLYDIKEDSESYKAIEKETYAHIIYLLAHPELAQNLTNIDWSKVDTSSIDVSSTIMSYLKDKIGLTNDEISAIRDKLIV